jgi:hypothetical protein
MADHALVRRYWLPTSLTAVSGAVTTYALAEAGKAGHHFWWVGVAAGLLGVVAGGVWAFRLQQSAGAPSVGGVNQRSAVQQLAELRGDTFLSSDRGGVSAVNIEGGVHTSPPPDAQGTSKT